MQLPLLILSLVIARPAVFSLRPIVTHVHVIEVNEANPDGKPLADAKVSYGLGSQVFFLDSTDEEGVASGNIDAERFGPEFNARELKKLNLVVRDANDNALVVKEIQWKSDDDLTRGFAVSVFRSRETTTSATETTGTTTGEWWCDRERMVAECCARSYCCPSCVRSDFPCETCYQMPACPCDECFMPCEDGCWIVPSQQPIFYDCPTCY